MKRTAAQIVMVILALISCQGQAQQLNIPEPLRFLALGDSYTIGQSVSAEERWPQQLFDSLSVRGFATDTVRVIATTGWTTLNLMDAISGKGLKDDGYNLVSLLIGVNDQYQGKPFDQYQPRLEALIDSALSFLNQDTSRLFIVSIPDYAYTPFGQNFNPGKISSEIDQYNAVNQSVAEAYGLAWFNVTPVSRQGLDEPDLVAPDNLHPSSVQYTRWVELMLDAVGNPVVGTAEPMVDHALRLFPNPCYGALQVEWSSDQPAELFVTDSAGAILVTRTPVPPRSTLALQLPEGVCTIVFQSNGKTVTRQVAVLKK